MLSARWSHAQPGPTAQPERLVSLDLLITELLLTLGEVPVAVAAVSEPGLDLADLRDFLDERLAHYKHPKALEIVDALPRNPAGKVVKTELRDRFGGPRK